MRDITVQVYATTLILSAFLLFSVQPMFAKMILPLLGGSPSVWNTAMVFFQATLLGGYAYAHLSSRYLPVRTQAMVHIGLLLAGMICLPFSIPAAAGTADAHGNPIAWQLGVMLIAIGLPFTVVSGTAPMVQRWFSTVGHKDSANPYFLYAASNFGSLAALIAYPLLIEVFLGTRQQTVIWSGGYALLIGMIFASALMTRGKIIRQPESALPTGPAPTMRDKLIWMALAFIPSSLMLSLTTYITTDIAAIPLLWVIPLTLYLATFIIAFARKQLISLKSAYLFLCVTMTMAAILFVKGVYGANNYAIIIYLVIFFCAALSAHLALAKRKPDASHLTGFYLYLSLGGVLGGAFNTFSAPYIFPVPFEFPLGLALALTIPFLADARWPDMGELKRHIAMVAAIVAVAIGAIFVGDSLSMTMIACVLILGGLMYLIDREAPFSYLVAVTLIFLAHPAYDWADLQRTLLIERNFFGVSRVNIAADGHTRVFTHGTTIHGTQAINVQFKKIPLTYYYPGGPAGDAFSLLEMRDGPQKIGAIGLGTGSVACYVRAGRHFDFYEIDPAVIRIAENPDYFTYLSGCGSSYTVIAGDGRLKMEGAADRSYDMIFLDAFSSDSIPAHVLTREAFFLYFSKLKDDGFILINTSNRHLDLNPLLIALSRNFNAEMRISTYKGESVHNDYPSIRSFDSRYAFITRNPDLIAELDSRNGRWQTYQGRDTRIWTDDYANILSLFYSGYKP